MVDDPQFNLFGEEVRAGALARPFVKWVGGKRNLLDVLIPRLPQFDTYAEPFIGGGALFFATRALGHAGPATISDFNERLITTYQAIRDDVEGIIGLLETHSGNHDLEYYKAARPELGTESDPTKLAAWFIYLNKTSFNGIYRVNRKDEYNVPMGTDDGGRVLDPDNLRACSAVLQNTTILFRSFADVSPTEADFFYFDPPYDDTFTGYSKTGFSGEDQAAVAQLCRDIDEAGNTFMASNSDTPLIRELYEGFELEVVKAMRSVNRDGKNRGRVGELLIRNY